MVKHYIDINDYKEIEKFIKENNATLIKVELRDLKNLLHEVVVEDIVEYEMAEKNGDFEVEIDKLGYLIDNGKKTKEFWNGKIQSSKKPLRLKIRNIC